MGLSSFWITTPFIRVCFYFGNRGEGWFVLPLVVWWGGSNKGSLPPNPHPFALPLVACAAASGSPLTGLTILLPPFTAFLLTCTARYPTNTTQQLPHTAAYLPNPSPIPRFCSKCSFRQYLANVMKYRMEEENRQDV